MKKKTKKPEQLKRASADDAASWEGLPEPSRNGSPTSHQRLVRLRDSRSTQSSLPPPTSDQTRTRPPPALPCLDLKCGFPSNTTPKRVSKKHKEKGNDQRKKRGEDLARSLQRPWRKGSLPPASELPLPAQSTARVPTAGRCDSRRGAGTAQANTPGCQGCTRTAPKLCPTGLGGDPPHQTQKLYEYRVCNSTIVSLVCYLGRLIRMAVGRGL